MTIKNITLAALCLIAAFMFSGCSNSETSAPASGGQPAASSDLPAPATTEPLATASPLEPSGQKPQAASDPIAGSPDTTGPLPAPQTGGPMDADDGPYSGGPLH